MRHLKKLLTCFFLCSVISSSAQYYGNGKLVITFLEIHGKDTGWGLSVIIGTPSGKTYIYDVGPGLYPNEEFDMGRDMIAPFLLKNKIRTIDGIVISHPHKDHFGGIKHLIRNFKIKGLYDTGYRGCRDCESEYENIYKPEYIASGGKYQQLEQGDILDWDSELEVEVLSPPRGYLGDNANINSLVLKIKYNKNNVLLTGDLSKEGQDYLITNYKDSELESTLISAPHHGDDSYLPFAKIVKPRIVVASSLNGAEKPARKAVDVFHNVGSKVYATTWEGTITIVMDGTNYNVMTTNKKN